MTLAEQLIHEACMREQATRLDVLNLARNHAGHTTGTGVEGTYVFYKKSEAEKFVRDVEKLGSYAQIIASTPDGGAEVQVQ